MKAQAEAERQAIENQASMAADEKEKLLAELQKKEEEKEKAHKK